VRASEISRRHLIEAQDAITVGGTNGRANSTVNSTLIVFSAAWRWAQDREMISVSWPKLDPLDESKPARPKRAYTDQEIDSVLAYVLEHDPSWHAPFALLAATGARLNDVLSLRSDDVLRAEGVVILRDPKTHEPVEVGVPEEVMKLLPQRAPGAFLFPSRAACRDGGPVTDSGALRCLRRTLRALKIADDKWLDLHSFRRSWCAASEEAGVARHQAMKQTGHKTGPMFDHYASKARGRAKETAEKVHAYRERSRKEHAAPSPEGDPEMFPTVFPSGENGSRKSLVGMGENASPKLAGGSGLELARRGSHAFARPSSGSASPSSASRGLVEREPGGEPISSSTLSSRATQDPG